MRLLVCGDRSWNDKESIRKQILSIADRVGKENLVVIEGECPLGGADILVREVCKEEGIEVNPYPADWNRYGRAAGPIRNKQMIVEGKPDFALAFHSNIEKSKGTKNMVSQLKKANIQCVIFRR